MILCSCCHAVGMETPPHGEGVPCPTATALMEAEIAEKVAHKELLWAQRDATLANNVRRS